MEDENYSSWSTKTLKRLAAAKDVVFLGRFVSFGELLDWSRRLSEAALSVTSFAEHLHPMRITLPYPPRLSQSSEQNATIRQAGPLGWLSFRGPQF